MKLAMSKSSNNSRSHHTRSTRANGGSSTTVSVDAHGGDDVSVATSRVVVHVVRPRMVTRALLKGTSPALDELAAEASSPSRAAAAVTAAGEATTTRLSSASALTSSATRNAAAAHTHKSHNGSSQTPSPATARAGDGAPHDQGSSARVVVVGGVLRCVCNAFLQSAQESLIECGRCRNYCHPACVGLDHSEVRVLQRRGGYVCPYCDAASNTNGRAPRDKDSHAITATTTTAAAAATHTSHGNDIAAVTTTTTTLPLSFGAGRQPPAPRQTPLKLREVPDCLPSDDNTTRQLTQLLQRMYDVAHARGYEVVDLPPATSSHAATNNDNNNNDNNNDDEATTSAGGLSPQMVDECLACCAQAVHDATFSASYPRYCLREVCARMHPYVQGTLLCERGNVVSSSNSSSSSSSNTAARATRGVVRALVLTNGMDVYGNLRSTIAQLKSDYNRGRLSESEVTAQMRRCMSIADVSDFVHVTLSATHTAHQRRGLARLLMTMELLKWALRGRTRAFLNMAIEKRLVEGGTRVECGSSPASRRLYGGFGFVDVYPRYDRVTGAERWTPREADMGRVMINDGFVPDVMRVARALCASTPSPAPGAAAAAAAAMAAAAVTAVTDDVHSSNSGNRASIRNGHGTAVTWLPREGAVKDTTRQRRALRLGGAHAATATAAVSGTRRARSASSSSSTGGVDNGHGDSDDDRGSGMHASGAARTTTTTRTHVHTSPPKRQRRLSLAYTATRLPNNTTSTSPARGHTPSST